MAIIVDCGKIVLTTAETNTNQLVKENQIMGPKK